MLCTAIWDSYRSDERSDVLDALSTILGPGQPDWSSKGVYAYWDRQTHDLLYLGLATDLPVRFAQHNGLVSHTGGNKKKQIDAYFAENELLGFTILIQSKAIAVMENIAQLDFTLGATAREVIAVGEGQLIEMHRLVYCSRPPWNGVGGSRDGARWATAAPALLEILAARRGSLFVARRSLRDLAESLRSRFFESTIHAARMRAVMETHEVGRLLEDLPKHNSEEIFRIISRSIMLRDGHIVQELDTSDDGIKRWLELLGDPEHWVREAAELRARLEESTEEDPPPGSRDRQLTDYLDSIISQAAPPAHIAATREILSTGYLDSSPALA